MFFRRMFYQHQDVYFLVTYTASNKFIHFMGTIIFGLRCSFKITFFKCQIFLMGIIPIFTCIAYQITVCIFLLYNNFLYFIPLISMPYFPLRPFSHVFTFSEHLFFMSLLFFLPCFSHFFLSIPQGDFISSFSMTVSIFFLFLYCTFY